MKRLITLFLMTAMVLLLAGCETPITGADLPDSWVVMPTANQGVFSEHGYYYTTPQGILYFLDIVNGGNVALCNKIGCKHELETYPEECEGYLSSWPMNFLPLVYENEKIYYTDPDYYGEQLYSRNADGTAKTHITTLGKEYSEQKKSLHIYDYLLADGMLYYCGEVTGEVVDDLSNYTQIIHEFDFIRRVDLKTGKDELLVKDTERVLRLHAVGGNTLIYDATTQPDPEDPESRFNLIRSLNFLNIETGTETTFLQKPFGQIGSIVEIRDNNIHIKGVSEAGEDFLTVYDLRTGAVKETKALPSEWFRVINDKYAYCHDWDQRLSQIYDIEDKTFLPGGIVGMRLQLLNTCKDGFIVKQSFPKPGGSAETGYEADYYYLCYCSFASLLDGFQQSDLIPFSFVDC